MKHSAAAGRTGAEGAADLWLTRSIAFDPDQLDGVIFNSETCLPISQGQRLPRAFGPVKHLDLLGSILELQGDVLRPVRVVTGKDQDVVFTWIVAHAHQDFP